jgi:apolipoprotein D and lipocalin family protein
MALYLSKAAGFIGLTLMVSLASCASQPVNRVSDEPLETVATVDTARYLGRWYEVARLPNSFEKNCEGVTADYSRRDDGLIKVVNTCRKDAADGKREVANGRARIVDTTSNAKLEVSFFGPFWGDYWIIRLAEDYSLSVVSEPKGRYLWVLSRTPTIDDATRADVLAFLENEGFDTSKLYFPQQPPVPDNPRVQ